MRHFVGQKKADHIQLKQLYHLFETQQQKALWITINIPYKILLPNEYVGTLLYLTTCIHVWYGVGRAGFAAIPIFRESVSKHLNSTYYSY
jgi:hypothetical protein